MNGAAQFIDKEAKNKSVVQYCKTLRAKTSKTYALCWFLALIASWCTGCAYDLAIAVTLFIVAAIILFTIKFQQVAEESLIVIAPLGLQTTTVYCAGTQSTQFIPWCAVQDVVVNEAVWGFRMIHYLAALVKHDSGKCHLLPLLLNSKLRLHEIEEVYRDIQEILQA